MQSKHNKQLVPLAKHLRKEMTKEERHLWYDFMCSYPVRFSRQKVLGKYIADFYSAEVKLVIELDGSQHYEDENMDKDEERTTFLEGYGLQVLRIPNNEVSRNFRGVFLFSSIAVLFHHRCGHRFLGFFSAKPAYPQMHPVCCVDFAAVLPDGKFPS